MAEKENVTLPGAPFGRGARENSGEWHPLIDWFDVYPGNRWKDRHGQFGLFDSPAGIRLQVEEAKVSPVLFAETADRQGGLLPLYAWKEDGLYRMLYRDIGGTAYAQSENGYDWTLPELGRIEFGGSTKNNLVCDQCVGHVMKDPHAPPRERFKGMVEVGGMFDPDTGEELEGEEGLKRMGEMQFGGSDYQGPRMVMRAFVRGFTSPDAMHWTPIERPVANMPSDGTGSNPTYEPETGTYFSYVRVHGLEQREFQTLAHSTAERDSARRCIGLTRTRDFCDWPPPKLVLHPDAQDGPQISFYGGFYFAFPGRMGIHCMLVHVFDQISGHVDNQIAFSRDGLLWDRPERRAAVPVGAAGSGCEGSVYAQGGLVELPDGYWAVPFVGGTGLHNGFHPGMPVDQEPRQMRWARWEPLRFCGIAAETEGRFTVPTLRRTRSDLRLNYRCENGGWIKVEVLDSVPSRKYPDAEGTPGLTFAECDWILGDESEKVVTWNGRSDISGVGDTICLRIRMFRAKVFAYQV